MSDVVDRIELVIGDITRQPVDAIVNAANSGLRGGGGVDGAIHRAAGPELMNACRALGGCPTGQVRMTPGFNLPARYVIHAVGPVYRGGRNAEAAQLASCYENALQLADQHRFEVIAFAAISCGVYGYPIPDAARIALSTARAFFEQHTHPRIARWVLFDSAIYGEFAAARDAINEATRSSRSDSGAGGA